jgi:outer membrane protein
MEHRRRRLFDSAERRAVRCAAVTWSAAAVLLLGTPAHAIQPLAAFIDSANDANTDLQVARVTTEQRDAEAQRAGGALLPSFTAQGVYTRNQYEVSFPASAIGGGRPGGGTITILPQNQLDASLTLSVPIIDVASWERRSAAQATLDGAKADVEANRAEVARRVAQAYYQLLGNEALLLAAQRALELSRANAALVTDRKAGGTATELDLQRANADVSRAEQDLSAARFAVIMSRRSLETLSGLAAEPSKEFPVDDLHEEAPLEQWLSGTSRLPSVRSAEAAQRSARASSSAASATWLPTLTASAQERITNAPSLTLHNEYYLLQATATWKLDATLPASVRAQRAAAATSAVKLRAAKRNADDAVFRDFYQVESSVEKSRSAREQVKASGVATELARDRFLGGLATQLDVLQSEQDLFRAEVARIQADADLAYARVALRLDAAGREGLDR